MDICYFCNKESTSSEYIPPKSFFPKGQRENLMTVPSCDEHNLEKSDIDEYIRTIFMGIAYDQIDDKTDFKNKPIKSLMRNNMSNMKKVFINSRKEILNNDIPTISIEIDTDKLIKFTDLLLKGIYYFKYNKKINFKITQMFHFLKDNFEHEVQENMDRDEDLTVNDTILGYNKNIFYYTINTEIIENKETCLIFMCFYKKIKISAFLEEI